MSRGNVLTLSLLFVGAFTTLALFASPQRAEAVYGDANSVCTPVRIECGCGQVMTKDGCKAGNNKYMCPCGDSTNGLKSSTGICMAEKKCQGQSSQGLDGAQQLLQMAKQIMDLLKGQGGGGGGGGETPPSQMPEGCLSGYYNTTSPSSTDPCAIYTPNPISDSLSGTSGTSGISDSLLNALNGGASVSETLTNETQQPAAGASSGSGASSAAGTAGQTQGSPFTPTTSAQLTGTVNVGNSGATIVANIREGLTQVVGFFGGNTFNGQQSQSVASRLCTSRPWAGGGLVASFAPDSFFDGLCSRAGYQVGAVAIQAAPAVTTTTTTRPAQPRPVATTTTQTTVNLIPPEVKIWAEPASVRLGSRAYIFWTTKGVIECAVTGPSFTQTTLSGGASTVPISGPTTFAIECTAPDGTKVSDNVTVNLAI